VRSESADLTSVIEEMLITRTSERQTRAIDFDQAAAMEMRKREGYF
jgi:sulfate adenylyltransferase subunit 2